MLAKYIVGGLAAVFLIAALLRLSAGGWSHPQVRPWFLIGGIFSVVSAWLFSQR
jgi:hypothetical protein